MIGSFIIVLTTYSTFGCIVAENINLQILWLSLQDPKIVSTYSRNPISNILSASSTTRNSKFYNEYFSQIYANFKGVDIKISVDFTKLSNYS